MSLQPTLTVADYRRISELADVSTTACGHSSNCTVTWPLGQSASVICEGCYQNRVPELKRFMRERKPVIVGEECAFGCGSGGAVRFYDDLEMNLCDWCVDRSEKAMKTAEGGYVPRLDVVPDEVAPGVLFIGPKESAYNRGTLHSLQISRVLVCCTSLPLYHSSDPSLRYHRLPIQDSISQPLTLFLPSALAFIAEGAVRNEATLVHCNAGVSRSGAIAVEWLSRSLSLPLEAALTLAKSKRSIISPNSGFLSQLGRLD